MGVLAGRNQDQNTQLAGTSQSLFMDTCVDCGAPVTIVSAHAPEAFRCPPCASVHTALVAEESDRAAAEAAVETKAVETDPS